MAQESRAGIQLHAGCRTTGQDCGAVSAGAGAAAPSGPLLAFAFRLAAARRVFRSSSCRRFSTCCICHFSIEAAIAASSFPDRVNDHLSQRPLRWNRLRTVSVGRAPVLSQWNTRASFVSITIGSLRGSYRPTTSRKRPLRAVRESAATMWYIGIFFLPIRRKRNRTANVILLLVPAI
jgi:hypothetical protein